MERWANNAVIITMPIKANFSPAKFLAGPSPYHYSTERHRKENTLSSVDKLQNDIFKVKSFNLVKKKVLTVSLRLFVMAGIYLSIIQLEPSSNLKITGHINITTVNLSLDEAGFLIPSD